MHLNPQVAQSPPGQWAPPGQWNSSRGSRTTFTAALILSLFFHCWMLFAWQLELPREAGRSPPATFTVKLRSLPLPSESGIPTDSIDSPETIPIESSASVPDTALEPMPGKPTVRDQSDPQTAEAKAPAPDVQTLLRDTIRRIDSDDDYRLPSEDREIGSGAFDSRVRNSLRASEDINQYAPARRDRLRSVREPDGSLYVETGRGSCFRVVESWEMGAPDRWQFTACRGGERLQLDAKPWLDTQ